MPPKQSTSTGAAPRGRPAGSKNKVDKSSAAPKAKARPSDKARGKQRALPSESPDPPRRRTHDEDEEEQMEVDRPGAAAASDPDDDDEENDEDAEKTIPPDLLTRILAEFFEKDGTRITKDANTAVAKYMDIFVKEAIARAAAERGSGFLEVRWLGLSLEYVVSIWLVLMCYPGRGSREDSPSASFRSLMGIPRRSPGNNLTRKKPATTKPPANEPYSDRRPHPKHCSHFQTRCQPIGQSALPPSY